jgi:hypothetical protein
MKFGIRRGDPQVARIVAVDQVQPSGELDLRISRDKKVIKEMKVKISQPYTIIPTIRLPE